jgi:hypothetical protein
VSPTISVKYARGSKLPTSGWVSTMALSHCYIETLADGRRSTVGLLGSWFSGQPWGTGNIYPNNGWEDSESCGEWSDECTDADGCVRRVAGSYPNSSEYNLLLGPNSNTFAGTIARECKLKKPSWRWTPGWNHSPARQKRGTTHRSPW